MPCCPSRQRLEKPRLLTLIPAGNPSSRTRGCWSCLSVTPIPARANDLYETPEVSTLALLAREPLPPTICEIEADVLRMPEGRQ